MARKKTQKIVRSKKEQLRNTIRNEILGILLIGLSCLGFVILYTNTQNTIAEVVVTALRMIAGEGSIGIFLVLAGVGLSIMGGNSKTLTWRILGFLFLWIAFEGFVHLGLSSSQTTNEYFSMGESGQGGGMIGAGISILLVKVIGLAGAYVFLVFLAMIGAILTINRSLVTMITDLFGMIRKVAEAVQGNIAEFSRVLTDGKSKNKTQAARLEGSPIKKKEFKPKGIEEFYIDVDDHLYHEPAKEENKSDNHRQFKSETIVTKIYTDPPVSVQNSTPSKNKLTGTPISRQTEKNEHYNLPPIQLLYKTVRKNAKSNKDLTENVRLLEDTLASFGVRVKVTRVTQGPSITRYELQPAPGVKVSKITSLADDISLSLAASDVRIEAPIPGKSAVGIEVPNKEIAVVHFREVLETEDFLNSSSKLSIALGKDITGNAIIGDLSKMPHLLIAGATGSGKSVCINTIIASIVFKAKPDEVKLLLIDPKMVELTNYNGIPHLIAPVVTEPQKAAGALKWIVTEMETRYELFASAGVRDIIRYNYLMNEKKEPEAKPLPYVVVIIDELSDLMMVAPGEVEDSICRLAQMARASGIHLIVATQRPSVDVITGLIKANIPSRIAFAVSSQIDSRTILDMGGAEKLLGRGDMLYNPIGLSKPVRVQGCFLSDKEVSNLVNHLIEQAKPEYCEIPDAPLQSNESSEQEDELFHKAANVFFENNTASVSLLQRRLRVGYTRAARIMDLLEDKGVVGPHEGSKPREILISKGQFEQKYGKGDE